MRFIVFTEAGTLRGQTHHRRYWDLVEEAVFAEEMGFYGWGTSEHHFYRELAATPSPEVLFTAVAMRTSRIKLRYMSRLISAIHPILVAEQTASTDIMSNGRVELAVARGNTLLQLDAFGISLDDTQERAEEALDLIVRALSDQSFSHDGKHWGKIPERELTPNGLQEPHPPLYKIGQTIDSIKDARRRGLGLITCDMWMGWDTLGEYLDAYNSVALSEIDPVGRFVTKSAAAMSITTRCAKTNDIALEQAERDLKMFATLIIRDLYVQLAERSPEGYGQFDRLVELRDRVDDVEWLRTAGPTVMIGDPEHLVHQVQRMKEMGADEVVLRIDNAPHEVIMETLENIGRYVIPYFSNPNAVLRSGPVGLLPGDPRQELSYEDTAKVVN
ncbi:LLM class flavin-dependent oxidoreductase [Gordonia sp. zg691]|uniref:LLM class flavin-dependent oxidoreductase n=1 Tax=Gordonia jinghuaiqii TaxID=2758710 RepID=A0A7D7QG31_9ACTN|nr:LLM class flavin-dependent oxidoreductase [Gordonia jinghuaiqii]MBD0860896.1 LLM class flavin-dependent oxidoreductase [Gordonia jinghuaiqii]MCR5979544.1 LLM class flavin-dependent oxidoreductase [Gordonia jinghuaiqii]QMT00662.1 LLM class flavin-dependent oxidoreductase [Gordonia jinghuaiqii]